jgi:hypothetical protein
MLSAEAEHERLPIVLSYRSIDATVNIDLKDTSLSS